MTDDSQRRLKKQIQQLDPYQFEKLVADLWESQGYETTVRQGSGDRGIDVVAVSHFPSEEKLLIQAKRFGENNKVGSEMIRKYATLYQQVPDADGVVIVTTSAFTSQAKRLADDLNVQTVNGEQITKYIIKDEIEILEYNAQGGDVDLKEELNFLLTSSLEENTQKKKHHYFIELPDGEAKSEKIGWKIRIHYEHSKISSSKRLYSEIFCNRSISSRKYAKKDQVALADVSSYSPLRATHGFKSGPISHIRVKKNRNDQTTMELKIIKQILSEYDLSITKVKNIDKRYRSTDYNGVIHFGRDPRGY
jgi:hypothetical protein